MAICLCLKCPTHRRCNGGTKTLSTSSNCTLLKLFNPKIEIFFFHAHTQKNQKIQLTPSCICIKMFSENSSDIIEPFIGCEFKYVLTHYQNAIAFKLYGRDQKCPTIFHAVQSIESNHKLCPFDEFSLGTNRYNFGFVVMKDNNRAQAVIFSKLKGGNLDRITTSCS